MAGKNPALMLSERNFEKYRDKWVAVPDWDEKDVILASHENLGVLQIILENAKLKNTIIFFVDEERGP